MSKRIKLEKIFLCQAEGKVGRGERHELRHKGAPLLDNEGVPIVLDCLRFAEVDSWEKGDDTLRGWSWDAPKKGYDKTDFVVLFEDGNVYQGRYDLMYFDRDTPDLRRHIKEFSEWASGSARESLPEEYREQYDLRMAEYSDDDKGYYRDILQNYSLN